MGTSWRARVGARTSRRILIGMLSACVAVVGSGCVYGPDTSLSYVQLARNSAAAGNTPWFCHSEGIGGNMDHSHGGAGGLANDYYAGHRKGDLAPADCMTNAEFFDKALAVAMKYPTRGIAKQAKNPLGNPGFIQSVQFVPGLGTHDLIAGVSRSGFDPEHPMFFQYDGNGDDARLAGLSWFVQQPTGVTGPPAGFAGDNDWWHTHATLCHLTSNYGVVVGNEISDEECARRGGKNDGLPGVWMAHAWILPGYEDTYDVFSGANMCVKGKGPITDPADPCKQDHSDPEHGHPVTPVVPTTVTTAPAPAPGGDHGSHDH